MTKECRICLGPHDEPFHAVRAGLRQWHRERLAFVLAPPPPPLQGRKPLRKDHQFQPKPKRVNATDPRRYVIDRPAAAVKAPRKPKAPAGAKQVTGFRSGHAAWNRVEALTIEAIVERQRRHMKLSEIAKDLGCRPQTIHDRMMEARRASPEYRAIDQELRTCACGNRKRACFDGCTVCRKRRAKAAGVPLAQWRPGQMDNQVSA